jgi:hypothetical protein
MYVAIVSREAVEAGEILDVVKTVHKLAELKAFQQLAISFHGYDDTATEVWETPEVRKWCHKLINKVPYLFYYLEQEAYETRNTIMLCLNDHEAVLMGDKKSPEEYAAEGKEYQDLPRYMIKIHIHQKSFRLMAAEIRKHARQYGSLAKAEQVIQEMSDMYAVSAD